MNRPTYWLNGTIKLLLHRTEHKELTRGDEKEGGGSGVRDHGDDINESGTSVTLYISRDT
jgi:hypothetical protein